MSVGYVQGIGLWGTTLSQTRRLSIGIVHSTQQAPDMRSYGQRHKHMPHSMRMTPEVEFAGIQAFREASLFTLALPQV